MHKWTKLTQDDKLRQMEALKALFQENPETDLKNDSAIAKKRNPIGVGLTIYDEHMKT